MIIGLTKDCIKGIHLLDNKKSDSRKLIQTKLAFSFEQTILLAMLTHQCLAKRTDGNLLHFTLLKHCAESIRNVLGDTNMQVIIYLIEQGQFPCSLHSLCEKIVIVPTVSHFILQVQAIGLQVLKGVLQKETNAEDISFLTFFTGEVIEDIFSMALNMLEVQKIILNFLHHA